MLLVSEMPKKLGVTHFVSEIKRGETNRDLKKKWRPQEPITRSLDSNCTVESTLSCIFLF